MCHCLSTRQEISHCNVFSLPDSADFAGIGWHGELGAFWRLCICSDHGSGA